MGLVLQIFMKQRDFSVLDKVSFWVMYGLTTLLPGINSPDLPASWCLSFSAVQFLLVL